MSMPIAYAIRKRMQEKRTQAALTPEAPTEPTEALPKVTNERSPTPVAISSRDPKRMAEAILNKKKLSQPNHMDDESGVVGMGSTDELGLDLGTDADDHSDLLFDDEPEETIDPKQKRREMLAGILRNLHSK